MEIPSIMGTFLAIMTFILWDLNIESLDLFDSQETWVTSCGRIW